jgi:hypothetical protein
LGRVTHHHCENFDDNVGLVSEADDEDNTSGSTNDSDVNDGDDDND